MRRDEWRVVDPSLVFKKTFFQDTGEKEPCPGWRELEESAKERDLVRYWNEKEGKTMNAGVVEEEERYRLNAPGRRMNCNLLLH
ncbi:hypothetical protein TNCV_2564491 [Trichonephila clavipes]|nr:hypothetical protein TNCV_2564491 [Trichonephila clavipes]